MQFPRAFPAEFPRPMPFVGDPIAAMFPVGKLGVSVEPYLRHTLSQDTAGATPVTAHGDPVGRSFARYGGGYHPVQAVALAKPLYKIDGDGGAYLEFDALNDSLATASSIPWGTKQATVIAVYRRRSDAVQLIARMGSNSGVGAWTLWGVETDSASQYAPLTRARGTANVAAKGPLVASVPAPKLHVVILRQDNGVGTVDLYQGGVLIDAKTGQGDAVIGDNPLIIGNWFSTSYPAMDLYGLIAVNWIAPPAVVDRAARYICAMARKAYA